MTTQHTPGPWTAQILAAQAIVADANGNAIADIARHEHSTTEQSYADETISANASLISAAPDLLSALQALTAIAEADDQFPVHTERARAAIAKAEGRE